MKTYYHNHSISGVREDIERRTPELEELDRIANEQARAKARAERARRKLRRSRYILVAFVLIVSQVVTFDHRDKSFQEFVHQSVEDIGAIEVRPIKITSWDQFFTEISILYDQIKGIDPRLNSADPKVTLRELWGCVFQGECEGTVEDDFPLIRFSRQYYSGREEYVLSATTVKAITKYTSVTPLTTSQLQGVSSTLDVRPLVQSRYKSRTLRYSRHVVEENGFYSELLENHLQFLKPSLKVDDLLDIVNPKTGRVDITFRFRGKLNHWQFKQDGRDISPVFYEELAQFLAKYTDQSVVTYPISNQRISVIYVPTYLAMLLTENQVF